ncbi:MAG: hypothetical protein DMF27_15035 [Verrucomicrobia bacterium]|nr:MAG: hypothetical protein DMF27_15035 [Verrucomicrobiota bacterium]
MQCRRAELSIGALWVGVLWLAGLDGWPACRVVRAHDCVRSKEPNALRDGRQCGNNENPTDEGTQGNGGPEFLAFRGGPMLP